MAAVPFSTQFVRSLPPELPHRPWNWRAEAFKAPGAHEGIFSVYFRWNYKEIVIYKRVTSFGHPKPDFVFSPHWHYWRRSEGFGGRRLYSRRVSVFLLILIQSFYGSAESSCPIDIESYQSEKINKPVKQSVLSRLPFFPEVVLPCFCPSPHREWARRPDKRAATMVALDTSKMKAPSWMLVRLPTSL